MQPKQNERIAPLHNECRSLKSQIRKEAKRLRANDEKVASLVSTLLNKTVELAEAKGGFFDDDDGDNRCVERARKVVELMPLIPPVPEDYWKRKEGTRHKHGFPKTRSLFWFGLGRATIMGNQYDKVFIPVLLKRIPLSREEGAALPEALKSAFGTICFESRFFTNLYYVKKDSEPLVVKAYMRHAAGAIEGDHLVEMLARLVKKKR